MTDKLPKAELAANLVGRDMLALIVGELKQARKPWHKLNESEQEMVIRRAEQDVRAALRRGFLMIVAADFQKATATLDSVQFTGKGVAGKLALKGDAAERHKLADSVGHEVVVILTSSAPYFSKMEEIQAEADQRPLPLDAPGAAPPDSSDGAAGDIDEDDEGVDGTTGDGAGIPASAETALSDASLEEVAHSAGLSFECVRDVMALVGLVGTPKNVAAWQITDRVAVIDYCGAKHVAETSADYLTKGGKVPQLPYVLGGAQP